MDDTRNTKLAKLLERLGRMIHAVVVDSDEVNACLDELREDGWDAVMFLEASMLCRSDEREEGANGPRIEVATVPETEYRLDPADARWLASLGISPTRHRSLPRRALPPLNQPHPSTRDDG